MKFERKGSIGLFCNFSSDHFDNQFNNDFYDIKHFLSRPKNEFQLFDNIIYKNTKFVQNSISNLIKKKK